MLRKIFRKVSFGADRSVDASSALSSSRSTFYTALSSRPDRSIGIRFSFTIAASS
jgi:hypothetical protein